MKETKMKTYEIRIRSSAYQDIKVVALNLNEAIEQALIVSELQSPEFEEDVTGKK